ncbi:MAG: hypothetical protein GY953_27555, partial [bacterium]|nr:hypothetical protein [bacterium]
MIRRAALFLVLAIAATAEPRLEMQFFHDKDDSTLQINDLTFPSERRGIACGFLIGKGKLRPTAMVTNDGGETWNFIRTKAAGLSLFFLNDSLGWMVTEGAVWFTQESGLSWRRLAKLKNIERVLFTDESHGYAVGARKSAYETHDGGRKWKKLPVADEPKAQPQYTTYGWIDFANPMVGVIAGWSRVPRRSRSRLPDWMDPASAQGRRQWPSQSIMLQTTDGGKSWKPSTTSMFGRIIRIRTGSAGQGLALVWFDDAFAYPSEVYLVEGTNQAAERVY